MLLTWLTHLELTIFLMCIFIGLVLIFIRIYCKNLCSLLHEVAEDLHYYYRGNFSLNVFQNLIRIKDFPRGREGLTIGVCRPDGKFQRVYQSLFQVGI